MLYIYLFFRYDNINTFYNSVCPLHIFVLRSLWMLSSLFLFKLGQLCSECNKSNERRSIQPQCTKKGSCGKDNERLNDVHIHNDDKHNYPIALHPSLIFQETGECTPKLNISGDRWVYTRSCTPKLDISGDRWEYTYSYPPKINI